MIHESRAFTINKVATLAAAAHELTRVRSWVLCQGFEVSVDTEVSWLLLNDSFSEDGLQEYGVCLRTAQGIRQADSYTVSWSNEVELTQHLTKIEADRRAGTLTFYLGAVPPLEPHPHPCPLCA